MVSYLSVLLYFFVNDCKMKNMPMQAVNDAQFPIGVEYFKTTIPTSTMKRIT